MDVETDRNGGCDLVHVLDGHRTVDPDLDGLSRHYDFRLTTVLKGAILLILRNCLRTLKERNQYESHR